MNKNYKKREEIPALNSSSTLSLDTVDVVAIQGSCQSKRSFIIWINGDKYSEGHDSFANAYLWLYHHHCAMEQNRWILKAEVKILPT